MRKSNWREVFRRFRNTVRDGADVTWCGRLFQTRAAATGNVSTSASRLEVVSCHHTISRLGIFILCHETLFISKDYFWMLTDSSTLTLSLSRNVVSVLRSARVPITSDPIAYFVAKTVRTHKSGSKVSDTSDLSPTHFGLKYQLPAECWHSDTFIVSDKR